MALPQTEEHAPAPAHYPLAHCRRRIFVAISLKDLIALLRVNVGKYFFTSKWAKATIKYETNYHPSDVKTLADHLHSINDMAAPVLRGSFTTDGMIVVPCSMKTLAAIHSGFCDDLVSRTADVMLKE